MTLRTKGRDDLYALVDDSDWDDLSQFNWHSQKDSTGHLFYACRHISGNNKKIEIMHRRIMGVTDPKIHVDHINHNTLDNQRHNLRAGSPSQNSGNSRLSRRNTSGYRGVVRSGDGWIAQMCARYIGKFDTPEKAATAYDKAAREHFGEFANLNFPSLGDQRREGWEK